MPKFRKKPVVVEAEQYHAGATIEGVETDCGCDEQSACSVCGSPFVRTLEGPLKVSEGDWIITGVKGERYPCKPDIFEATYEPVESDWQQTAAASADEIEARQPERAMSA